MKRIFIILLIVTIFLVACGTENLSAQNDFSATGGGSDCLDDREQNRYLCIDIRSEKDEVQAGEVLPITITVTSMYDEPNLVIFISTDTYPDFMERIQFPEQTIRRRFQFGMDWEFSIKANETIVFNGIVTFDQEFVEAIGVYSIYASIDNVFGERLASENFAIFFRENIGVVHYAGTSLPSLRTPLLEPTYFYADDIPMTVTPQK
jgi:hypothetical protein